MKVLVLGNGGREHALAWRLAQGERVTQVFVAPGNGGTARDPLLKNVPITDVKALADFAVEQKITLTVVGPEAFLAAGVVDEFRARGLRIFGPTKAAAQLESSKAFAKEFMKRHGIPTAAYETFSDATRAHAYVDAQGAPIVIKADGLAAGKGVVVAMTLAEAMRKSPEAKKLKSQSNEATTAPPRRISSGPRHRRTRTWQGIPNGRTSSTARVARTRSAARSGPV